MVVAAKRDLSDGVRDSRNSERARAKGSFAVLFKAKSAEAQ